MDQEARWRAGWRPHEDFMKISLTPDWVKELRRQYPWKGEGLIVVSMFDGMGGCWQALKELGIPVKKGYSCEIKDFANEVVKARFPEIIHLGSVADVTRDMIPEQVDLIVAGFPCQDLSRMGNQLGLHGARSGLFFHIPRFISMFKAKWFLVENVKCRWQDQAEVTKHLLGVLPLELNAEELSPQSRLRYYWTNLPLPPNLPGIRDCPETSVQHFLKTAIAPFAKTGTVLTTNCDANTSRVALKCVYDIATGGARYMDVDEIEIMMGYPFRYSDIPFAKKSSGRRGWGSKGGAEGPPQKRPKHEGGANNARQSVTEKESGAEEVRMEEAAGAIEKGIIALSSDEEDVVLETGGELWPALEDGSGAPSAALGGAASEEYAGDSEPPENSALALTPLPGAGGAALEEAGSSGLSNEEKSGGSGERSSGYGLRDRKPVNYAVEHVEIDAVGGSRQASKRRIRNTPRRSLLAPVGETLSVTKELRWELLGNSFVVPCIALMLAPLLSPQLRARAKRIEHIPTPDVKDACLFKEGEVWALYNKEMAPNWYACLTKVDATCPEWDGRKKRCTQFSLKYRFYEFTPETDACPAIGTGVLQLAGEEYTSIDKAFSHRVEPALLDPERERILVYPRPGDVWVVKDKLRKFGRFKMHVYVVDSKADEARGGFTCSVRSLVLQARPTSHITIYRITDEERVISGGRMIFSYQVPYFYKNEAGLLYVEPQNDQTVGVLKRRKEEEWDGDEDDVAAEEQELEEREDVPGSEYPPALPQVDPLPKPPNTTSTAQALQLVRLKTDSVRGQQPKPDLGQAEDVPSARSRKGKEKVDIDEGEGDVDEIAGVLPTDGSGHLEQRTTIKSSDVHWLTNSLPEVAPLYHGRFLPRGEGVRTR